MTRPRNGILGAIVASLRRQFGETADKIAVRGNALSVHCGSWHARQSQRAEVFHHGGQLHVLTTRCRRTTLDLNDPTSIERLEAIICEGVDTDDDEAIDQ